MRLGVEENYVWCLGIVVIFMRLVGAKMWGRCFKFIIWGGKSRRRDKILWGFLTIWYWYFETLVQFLLSSVKVFIEYLFLLYQLFIYFVPINIWPIKSVFKCLYYLKLFFNPGSSLWDSISNLVWYEYR